MPLGLGVAGTGRGQHGVQRVQFIDGRVVPPALQERADETEARADHHGVLGRQVGEEPVQDALQIGRGLREPAFFDEELGPLLVELHHVAAHRAERLRHRPVPCQQHVDDRERLRMTPLAHEVAAEQGRGVQVQDRVLLARLLQLGQLVAVRPLGLRQQPGLFQGVRHVMAHRHVVPVLVPRLQGGQQRTGLGLCRFALARVGEHLHVLRLDGQPAPQLDARVPQRAEGGVVLPLRLVELSGAPQFVRPERPRREGLRVLFAVLRARRPIDVADGFDALGEDPP